MNAFTAQMRDGLVAVFGTTMQLPMDIRMASTKARFGLVFARRGITPEAASTWFLSRLVGMQTALEWCFTGRLFSAQEAKDCGLVRSLHAPDELLPAACALAREIADNSAPVSIALTRQMLWRMAGRDHPHEGPPHRQSGDPVARAIGRCARGRQLRPREAPRVLCQQGVHRHAGFLSLVGRTRVRVKALGSAPGVVAASCQNRRSQATRLPA